MKQVATVTFADLDTSDEVWAIVKSDGSSVIFGLSLKSDGDLQVVMKKSDAKLLADALREASS